MKTVYQVLEEMLGEEQAAMMLDRVNGPDKHLQRCIALTQAMRTLSIEEWEIIERRRSETK